MIECDEVWSFVGHKGHKRWIWLALGAATREIVGVHVGGRDRAGAEGLWRSLPGVCRQCAVCYTEFWSSYAEVFPSSRHRAVEKNEGKTSHIERFNGSSASTERSVSGSRAWCGGRPEFSKKLANHIGAIWLFVHHYNASLQL